MDPRVDAGWISSRLDDPSMRVVEVDVSPAAYEEGHIPGAVLWNAYGDLRDAEYMPLVPKELEGLIARSGIEPGTTAVFYGYGAVLGYWLLKAHGHPDVRVLEGDRERWAEGGGEWSTEVPAHRDGGYSLADPEPRGLASRAAVESALEDPGALLLDVRSELEFSGERFWPSGATADVGRAGRIPGAVNLPIEELREEDGSLRGEEQLRRAAEEHGVSPDRAVIAYCTIGNRAAQACYALDVVLGYPDVRLYYNSWVEWGRRDETPIDS
jgi:thiosulfate/3-mercaptopyruvate sulfurtransferase